MRSTIRDARALSTHLAIIPEDLLYKYLDDAEDFDRLKQKILRHTSEKKVAYASVHSKPSGSGGAVPMDIGSAEVIEKLQAQVSGFERELCAFEGKGAYVPLHRRG